jgi:hypothetical protein
MDRGNLFNISLKGYFSKDKYLLHDILRLVLPFQEVPRVAALSLVGDLLRAL